MVLRGRRTIDTLIITQDEVRDLLPMGECIDAVRSALAELAAGRGLQPLRPIMWLPEHIGALAFGFAEGIALAALLLAANNVFKVVAYRSALPWRAAAKIVVLVVIGAAVGTTLLVSLPEGLIGVFVVVSLVGTLWAERTGWSPAARVGTPVLAFASGASSGVSGTSGPLKGAAIRNLNLDRAHFVGAASLVSLAGDVTKAGIFAEAGLLGASAGVLMVMSVPLMMLGTAFGRRLNRNLGERGFAVMFWTVMTGYAIRLVAVLG